MTSFTVTQAKAKLSAVLRRIKRGETVLITERGRPIARLGPAMPADEPEDERLRRMIAAGVLLPPRRPMSAREWKRFLAAPRTPDPDGAVHQALLDDRYEGR